MRQRRAQATEIQLAIFNPPVNIDVHLHSPIEAVAVVSGAVPEYTYQWLANVVGSTRELANRRVAFPTSRLDRLLSGLPPANITLDAASASVARALWAKCMGLSPLKVTRHRQRLIASSSRWPTGLGVVDAPWTAIATMLHLQIPLDVDPSARSLMTEKISKAGEHIASAWLAGSAIMLESNQPELLEALSLPALAYAGSPRTGRYRIPLLAAATLLDEPSILIPPDVASAIKRANKKTRPLSSIDGFPWELYPFQARDAAIALRILETSGGVLLAGEMGSGKTTVALAIAHTMELFPLLVVCPLAAMSTWARQLSEMNKTFLLATGSSKDTWAAISTSDHDAVVISYDRLHAFLEVIESRGFKAIIADELQRTRTPSSRRSRALRSLAASVPIRIGLSGTPLQNRIDDLLAPASFLVPGEFKPRTSTKDLSDLYPGDPIEAIAEHVGALMVRRRMEDTGIKLPNKTVRRLYVDLSADQRRALSVLESEAEVAKDDGSLDRMHAFAKLQKMRQIISCPAAANIAGLSPKVAAALDLVEEFTALGRKCVIFCANRRTWTDLASGLDRLGIGHTGIWGSTPIADRLANEQSFHHDDTVKVFIGTIQSCAESLTLSPTGTVVIHCDYVYNPSDLAQAEARVYRMNQVNPVDVIYLHARAPGGTLDDRMTEILELKRALFAQVIDRTTHTDNTHVSYSLGDLVYLLTGTRDAKIDSHAATEAEILAREQALKRHAKVTLYKHKGVNKRSDDFFDDGSMALLLDDFAGDASALPSQQDIFSLADDYTLDTDDDDFDITEEDMA